MANPPSGYIPLVHAIGTRDGTLTKDALMVNMVAEVSENGLCAIKRPGLGLAKDYRGGVTQLLDGMGQFTHTAGGVTSLYSIYNSNTGPQIVKYSKTGSPTYYSLTNTLTSYQFDVLSDTPIGSSYIKNSSNLYIFDGSSAVQVPSLTNYPTTTVQGLVYIDGTYYVMDTNAQIRGSGINNPASWDPLNFIAADISLGKPVRIHRHLNYLVAFMDQGMQLFYDAGNATGSPLSPVSNAQFRVGCGSATSVVEINDGTYWVGSSNQSQFQVYAMVGLQIQAISTPFVEKIIAYATQGNGVLNAFATRIGGHSYYCLSGYSTLPGSQYSSFTLTYDLSNKMWTLWSSSVNGQDIRFVGINPVSYQGVDFFQDYSVAKLYTLQDEVAADDSGPIKCVVRTPTKSWGTINRKFVPVLNLFSETVPDTVTVRWTDDDYQTYTTPRTIDMSKQRKMLHRCGSTRERAWELTYTGNYRPKFYALECTPEVGAEAGA